MTPGPPAGQPLLNAHENQDLDNFLQGFDQSSAANKQLPHAQFNVPSEHDQVFDMPPMFVGSDTALGHRSVVDPHQLAGGGFPYGNSFFPHDMNTMTQGNPLVGNLHGATYTDPSYQNPLMNQLHTSASMQPAYTQGWQQSFPTQNMMNVQTQGRVGMGFGTDSRFQPTGYAAPHNPMDPDLPQGLQMNNVIGDWLEPTSASTTQPNTQPNTQPSSPNWSKKRNFDEFAREQQPRNGFVATTQQAASAQSSPPHSNSRRKRSVVKSEPKGALSQPPTPISSTKPHTPLEAEGLGTHLQADHEEDAEAEEEEEEEDEEGDTEQQRSPSPTQWPGSRPRPHRNIKSVTTKPRKKRSTANTSTPTKTKAKSHASQKTTSTRAPLSLEQKKANHTNSEQRRRDATARAYAELYDLVPELEDLGKQSTMKKLEIVVAKVQRVKQRTEELRAKLGMDPTTGFAGRGVGGGGFNVRPYGDVPGWNH